MNISEISPEVYDLARRAEELAAPQFAALQEICEKNTLRVMEAFQANRVSEACFAGTTGYGYDDLSLTVPGKVFLIPVSLTSSSQEQVRCHIYSFSCNLS